MNSDGMILCHIENRPTAKGINKSQPSMLKGFDTYCECDEPL